MLFRKLRPFLRDYLLVLAAICAWYLLDHRHSRGTWFVLVAVVLLVAAIAVAALLKPIGKDVKIKTTAIKSSLLRKLILLGCVVLVLAFFLLEGQIVDGSSGPLLLAYLFAGAAGLLLSMQEPQHSPYLQTGKVLLVLGGLYKLGSYLPGVQATPFALGWSEGSRYYNASVFFGRQVYGHSLPLPVLHPSRYLMQALPFALGIHEIMLHRIWQVLLWLLMTGFGAWVMAGRLKGAKKKALPFLILGLGLFFFQGAVYYHLMLCVLLVLLGYRARKPWRNLIAVLIASIWAGLSRINWIPVPALLAVSLYLLDEAKGQKNIAVYLGWPAVWTVLGLAAGWAAKQGYMVISGEPAAYFDSAFNSALLWKRLFPNATFFLGILPATLLVMLPGAWLLLSAFRGGLLRRLHWLRWLGLAGILSAFLGGGILVSLKIGGGGDLHNLDAFLVFWALIIGSLLFGVYQAESPADPLQIRPAGLAILLAALVPVFFAFLSAANWGWPDQSKNQAELAELRQALQYIEEQDGDTLFISERQLLTFGEITGVEVVSDYEKVFLMEMAMANNRSYLDAFVARLEAKDFKAIILDPVTTNLQNESRPFAAENNAWKKLVLYEILDSYEPALSWQEGEVNLLLPRGQDLLRQELKELFAQP